jgi:hypothetical protein
MLSSVIHLALDIDMPFLNTLNTIDTIDARLNDSLISEVFTARRI